MAFNFHSISGNGKTNNKVKTKAFGRFWSKNIDKRLSVTFFILNTRMSLAKINL